MLTNQIKQRLIGNSNMQQFLDYILHIDVHLQSLLQITGVWTYFILFLIIFCETGLVVLPLLPGDSLLFAAGSLAAVSTLNIHYLAISLCIAAILGDTVNYAIGNWIGHRIFHQPKSRLFNPAHLHKTHNFYQRYGGKTIIIARFIPIIRTFAPFVAGIGKMHYRQFALYNIIGAILWVYSFLYISFYFGNIPIVKQHFSLVIMAIIIISIMLPIVEYLRSGKLQQSSTK